MVFWSSFSKKIKQAVSQISFDALKRRVDTIEADYATKTYTDTQNQAQDVKIDANTTNITNNTNDINALDTKVDGVISGLQNGNIINYTGPFDVSKTYSIAQATTYNDKWYVSNQNNNVGHTPTGSSDAYWELLSEPTINLQPYLTKTEASNTYATKTTVNGIDTRLTTAEQTLNTNSTNIVNLNNTKANKSDVYTKTEIEANYYNKAWNDARRIKFKDVLITNNGILQTVVNNYLWKVSVETDWEFDTYQQYLDNFDFYNIRFLNARYTNWKYKITATYSYTKNGKDYLALVVLITQPDTYTYAMGDRLRIWYSDNINI